MAEFTKSKKVKFTDLTTVSHKEKVRTWMNQIFLKGIKRNDPKYPELSEKMKENLKWIKKNHKKIYDYIKKYENQNTIKTHLNDLGVILRDYFSVGNEIYSKYLNESLKLKKEIEEELKEQKLSPKEIKNFVTLDDIIEKRKELKEKFEENPKDRKIMFQYLFISLQSYIPPLRRQEYRNMEIVTELPTKKKKNYLFENEYSEKKYTVIINKDKVSKKKGSDKFTIESKTLQKIIDKTLLYFKRKYLFSGLRNGDKPINKDVYTKNVVNKIFEKEKKHATLNTYRKAYVTYYWNKPNFSKKDKENLARRMRHSVDMADLNYKKIIEEIDKMRDDDEDDDDESSDDESSDDEVEEKKEKKQLKKKKEVSDDESSDDEVEEKKEKKEVKKKKFNHAAFMKKYQKEHSDDIRINSRNYYNNNKERVLRRKILANANKYGVTKKPTQKSIDKYKLVYDKKSKSWK